MKNDSGKWVFVCRTTVLLLFSSFRSPLVFLTLVRSFPALFLFFFSLSSHSYHPHSLPGYCFCILLCAPVGNSAFPVILLVRWFSVDFQQTVGSALREGLVLYLQSLLIMLSSFKQPADNRQSPSKTPATHNVNIGILLLVSMENAI